VSGLLERAQKHPISGCVRNKGDVTRTHFKKNILTQMNRKGFMPEGIVRRALRDLISAGVRVYFAFPDGNPGYTFIAPLKAKLMANDYNGEKLSDQNIIFYIVAATPRISHETPRHVSGYQCKNVVLIRFHQNAENLGMDDSWITPSVVNGNRATIAAAFVTKISSNGISTSITHIITDEDAFFKRLSEVLWQVPIPTSSTPIVYQPPAPTYQPTPVLIPPGPIVYQPPVYRVPEYSPGKKVPTQTSQKGFMPEGRE
jgi:hypothetical protein